MNLKSVTGKNWLFKKYDVNYVKKISETFNFDEILCKFLSIRKIKIDRIKNFLNPTIKNNLPNPASIKDMKYSYKFSYNSYTRKKYSWYFC